MKPEEPCFDKRLDTINEIISDDIIKDIYSRAYKKLLDIDKQIQRELPCFRMTINIFMDIKEILDTFININYFKDNMGKLKWFDQYTFDHSIDVSVYSIIIGINMKLEKKDLIELAIASIFHDIGKVFIPIEIVNKSGKLSDEEWNTMKTHPEIGSDYLKSLVNMPKSIHEAILYHHEKMDGTGYPQGLSMYNIPIFSKIISIADTFDALTSDRPYREKWSLEKAIDYVLKHTGTHFDRDILRAFKSNQCDGFAS